MKESFDYMYITLLSNFLGYASCLGNSRKGNMLSHLKISLLRGIGGNTELLSTMALLLHLLRHKSSCGTAHQQWQPISISCFTAKMLTDTVNERKSLLPQPCTSISVIRRHIWGQESMYLPILHLSCPGTPLAVRLIAHPHQSPQQSSTSRSLRR